MTSHLPSSEKEEEGPSEKVGAEVAASMTQIAHHAYHDKSSVRGKIKEFWVGGNCFPSPRQKSLP